MEISFAQAKGYFFKMLPHFECRCGSYLQLHKFNHGTPLLMYKYCENCNGGKDWMYAYSKVKDVTKKARMTNRVKSNADFISTCRCSKCKQQKVFGKWSYKDEWAVLPYSVFTHRSIIKKGFIYCEACAADMYAVRPARGVSSEKEGSVKNRKIESQIEQYKKKLIRRYNKFTKEDTRIVLATKYVRIIPIKHVLKGFRRKAARLDRQRLNARLRHYAAIEEAERERLELVTRTCSACKTSKLYTENFIVRDKNGMIDRDHSTCHECRKERQKKYTQKMAEKLKSEEYQKQMQQEADLRLLRFACDICESRVGERMFFHQDRLVRLDIKSRPWRNKKTIVAHLDCVVNKRKEKIFLKSQILEVYERPDGADVDDSSVNAELLPLAKR